MIIGFLPALGWLDSATGDAAKAGDAREFRFTPPPKVPPGPALPFIEADVGTDVLSRVCCALGAHGSIDFPDVGVHRYRRGHPGAGLLEREGENGGRHGFIYTRHGGFIDLGHARDNIDYARFFAARYYNAPSTGRTGALSFVFNEGADIHLEIPPRSGRPAPELAAAMGARLAYERALWHEIVSFFATPNPVLDERFSSFAPEDLFSNAVGVLAGYQAILTPDVPFDRAAEQALHRIIARLGPVHRKEETDAVIALVKGHWWTAGAPPPAKRRNFDAFSPVRPWLVTDIVIDGKETEGDALRASLARPKPASILIPAEHAGRPLDSLAHFEFKNLPSGLAALVPSLPIIRSSDLPTVVDAVRAEARSIHGNDVDLPGRLAP